MLGRGRERSGNQRARGERSVSDVARGPRDAEERRAGLGIYFSNLVSTSATMVPPARARSWAPRCSYSANALRLLAKPSRPTSSWATCRRSTKPGDPQIPGKGLSLLEEGSIPHQRALRY